LRRNVELSIAANLSASRLSRLSSFSRRYDVSNDHTLTAVDPRGLDLDNLHISASELPSFLAVTGFESEIGMAVFVQLLGVKRPAATFTGTEAQDAETNRSISWEGNLHFQ